MMERILLGVFYLSGWHIFSSCLAHHYHYVAIPMNWTEAQAYCRDTHLDLATIQSTEEMNQLLTTVSSVGKKSEVWIGLYRNLDWRWSDGYNGRGAEYRYWRGRNPACALNSTYHCIMIDQSNPWYPWRCSTAYPFVCNNGTQQEPKFVHVNTAMNWSNAQKHCREHFRDLATVRNITEYQEILNMILSGNWPWIGLFRDPNSYWSDGSTSSFRFWDTNGPVCSTNTSCGVAALQSSGKWRFMHCGTRLPFICNSTPPLPLKKRVVKLRIKPGDASMDLNDPAVKEGILTKLQDRLKAIGMSGVTLTWKEQPHGKVFYKEGERSQKKP